MFLTRRDIFIATQILSMVLLGWPAAARGQAPAGPLPAAQPQPPSSPEARPQEQQSAPVKPRTSIMGGWKLNQDESDDPRKKMQDARSAGGGQGGGRGGVRMGIPGMGGGPWGGGGGRRGGGNESDEDRQRMQEVMTASRSLTVAEAKKDVEVDVFDDQDRKTAIFTDGRKLQKSKDTTNQEVAAHWDGNRLVTDEKTPSGKKMSRTYELSYDGTQLYETLKLTRGRSDSQFSIRYVYDQADARAAKTSQTRQ
jgi:YD repeat-containing protein